MGLITEINEDEVPSEIPAHSRVMEDLRIDRCCGDGNSVKEVSVTSALSPECILNGSAVGEFVQQPLIPTDWERSSLFELASHIVNKHHVFTRTELDRLEPLLLRVVSAHAHNHSELPIIQDLFTELKRELLVHMLKEERVLFPYLVEMEEAEKNGTANPVPFFGTVRNPIQVMLIEHDRAAELLRAIRKGTDGFSVPEDGCPSFRALYSGLAALDEDLRKHILLENDILFRRAVKIESL
jgi:regulator of cell morphogenesis and NO signaling